jgi:hypothetical protein
MHGIIRGCWPRTIADGLRGVNQELLQKKLILLPFNQLQPCKCLTN